VSGGLLAHLAEGLTTLCRCWRIRRKDGLTLGFTDHDRRFDFEDVAFLPEAGLSAGALMQGTGLAVDNVEALGVLSADAICATDLEAGRFDGADVTVWLVNWAKVDERRVLFAGSLGEVRRGGGAFQAELRGLTEGLNRVGGLAYVRQCTAVLGDARCRFATSSPGFRFDWKPLAVERGQRFVFAKAGGIQTSWFERGRLFVLSGAGAGLEGVIKHDRTDPTGQRIIELWEPVRAMVTPDDTVRLEAGCDKRSATCKSKFSNIANFRGFPFVPGEDWLLAIPATQPGVVAG
jgi:uncharacterized phage protein (TIGR02218 family)